MKAEKSRHDDGATEKGGREKRKKTFGSGERDREKTRRQGRGK